MLNQKAPFTLLAVALSVVFISSSASAQKTCAKATVVDGDTCANLKIRFNFAGCPGGRPQREVQSACWNDKAVARATSGNSDYVATYRAAKKGWRLLSLRREAVANPSATATAADIVEPAAETDPVRQALAESAAHAKSQKAEPSAEPDEKPETKAASEHSAPRDEHAPELHAHKLSQSESVHSEEEEGEDEPLEFKGLVDAYYTANFNKPGLVTLPVDGHPFQPAAQNAYRAFDIYSDTFAVALAQLTIDKEHGPFRAHLNLGFSNDADVISPNDVSTKNVLEAFLRWQPNSEYGWSLKIGKMFTYMGMEEVTMAQDEEEFDVRPKNWFYSRSLLFTYAVPLWHTGAEASYLTESKKLRLSGYVMNNWNSPYENNQMKTLGGQLAYFPRKGTEVVYGIIRGVEAQSAAANSEEVRTVHDIYASSDLGHHFSVQAEYVNGSEPLFKQQISNTTIDLYWESWQVGAKYAFTKWYTLAARFEKFDDRGGYALQGFNGALNSLPQIMTSLLLNGTFDVGYDTKIYVEYRNDQSDQNAFVGNSSPSQQQSTLTTSMVFEF